MTAGGSTAVSLQPFVVPVPAIANFSPQFVNPGDTVTVTGSNLNLDPGFTAFSVQGTGAVLLSLTNTVATIEAPDVSGPILVDTSYGQATSVDSLYILPASIDPTSVVGLATLEQGTAQSLSMGAAGKRTVFEFDAVEGRHLAFRILSIATVPSGANVSYQLISPSGTTVTSGSVSSSGPSTIDLPVLDPVGRYFMVFNSGTSTSVDITAKVELYPELEVDGTSFGYVGSIPGYPETYTFMATAGEDLGLGLTDLSVTASSGVYVYVYRPSGAQWGSSQSCYESQDPGCSRDLRNLPDTGEYRIRISPHNSSALASYTLTLSHHVAGTLVPDTPQTVAMTVPGQQALYEFTATAGQTVAVGISSIATTPSGKQIQLRAYNASGSMIGSTQGSSTAVLNLPNLAAGTYTVWLWPYDAATGSVVLEVEEP